MSSLENIFEPVNSDNVTVLLSAISSDPERFATEFSRMKKELRAVRYRLKSTMATLSDITLQLVTLESESDTLKDRVSDAESALEFEQRKSESVAAKNRDLLERNYKLIADNDELESRVSQLTMTVADAKEEVRSLRDRLGADEDDLDKVAYDFGPLHQEEVENARYRDGIVGFVCLGYPTSVE